MPFNVSKYADPSIQEKLTQFLTLGVTKSNVDSPIHYSVLKKWHFIAPQNENFLQKNYNFYEEGHP